MIVPDANTSGFGGATKSSPDPSNYYLKSSRSFYSLPFTALAIASICIVRNSYVTIYYEL
jgi:hypothetical protein